MTAMYEYEYEDAPADYYQHWTMPGMGLGKPSASLLEALQANSITKHWAEMRFEWCFTKRLINRHGFCVCGVPIVRRYLITNRLTYANLVIGSTCVTHIWNSGAVKLLDAIDDYIGRFQKLRSDVGHANANTLLKIPKILQEFALKAGWLTTSDCWYLETTYRGSLDSNISDTVEINKLHYTAPVTKRLEIETKLYACCVGDYNQIAVLKLHTELTPQLPKPIPNRRRDWNPNSELPTYSEMKACPHITDWDLKFIQDMYKFSKFSEKQVTCISRIQAKLLKPKVDLSAFRSTTHLHQEDIPNPNAITRANLPDFAETTANSNCITRADLPPNNPVLAPGIITRADLPSNESNPWVSK